jgi:hypothetical protein
MRLLDLADTHEVIEWANAALAEDPTNDSLVALAILDAKDGQEVDSALDAVMAELGVAPLDSNEAAMILAKETAKDIIAQKVMPHDGARFIWVKLARKVPEVEEALRVFIGLASEWEEDPSQREQYDADIVGASRRLVSQY